MKTFSPFFAPGDASVPYLNTRDAPAGSYPEKVKLFIEQMWDQYWPYADNHFLSEVRQNFHQRTWEMYIAWVLMQEGFPINKVGDSGAEFYLEIAGRRTWIEAIAPRPGTSPDAVPPLKTINEMIAEGQEPIAQPVPEEQILLRLTHALWEKAKKHKIDIGKKRVAESDSYVLAINGWESSWFRGEPRIPFIVKATLGFGGLAVPINIASHTHEEPYWNYRSEITRQNGQTVSTIPFLSQDYSGISGIIYSHTDIFNVDKPYGRELLFLQNPFATNKVSPRGFTFCREYQPTVTDGNVSLNIVEPF